MLDGPSWVRLIDGLTQYTGRGRIRWERKGSAAGDINLAATVSRAFLNSMNQPKIFGANAGQAMYEIASSDGYGGAPYEFRVWEFEGTKIHSLGTVKSSTNVGDSVQFEVNEALKRLFMAVDESTESSEQIVDRLLGGFGENG
jgi:hypothetical protein